MGSWGITSIVAEQFKGIAFKTAEHNDLGLSRLDIRR
jgi:hypothetical protein